MRLTLTAIATGLAVLLTAPVHAGGAVVIEEPEVTAPDRDNAWVVPLLLGLLAVGLIASGGGDAVSVDVPDDKPQPCAKQGDGC